MQTMAWASFGLDRKSTDGRFQIRHPENSPSGRWELYDVKAKQWHGDWRTLTSAKRRAELVARTGGDA